MTDEELIARLRSMHWCVTTKANGVGVSDEAVAPEAADRIEELMAKLAKAVAGLEKCQEELDEYSRQEYPLDHPVHERYRQRDYDANTARATLAEIKGESHDPL